MKMDFPSYRINPAIQYIEDNLPDSVNIHLLADLASYSYHRFHHVFTGATGEPVWGFVKRLRLERAAYLLRHTPASVADIADQVGYGSNASLSKAFQHHFRCSPNRFRKEKRQIDREANIQAILNYESPAIRMEPAQLLSFVRGAGKQRYTTVWRHLNAMVAELTPAPEGGACSVAEGETWTIVAKTPDIPDVTEEAKLRYDAGLALSPERQKVFPQALTAPLQNALLEAGKYAVFQHAGACGRLPATYYALYNRWLFESGYVLRNAPWFHKYTATTRQGTLAEQPAAKGYLTEQPVTEVYLPIC